MAPTKEPIQDTPAETREPMSAMIAAIEPTAGVDVRTPHFKIYLQPDNIFNKPDCNKKESKTDKIANRLRKKKGGELLKKPSNKGLHISHGVKHPPNGTGRKLQERGEHKSRAKHSLVAPLGDS